MKTSAPKFITWWIAFILGALGLLGFLGTIAALSPYAFWLAFFGLVLMLVAVLVKGL
jgi:hypothetical protein